MLQDAKMKNMLHILQRNEITEYYIYSKLARDIRDENNAKVLRSIAEDEKKHAEFWKSHTGKIASPNRWKIFWFYWVSRILGITFGIKLMEKGESKAEKYYIQLASTIPEAKTIAEEEEGHEKQLIELLHEEKLQYIGSIVLGLNDALVELTGALAGFTLALQNNKLVALAGLITGIAASFSMASSEYLSNKAEDSGENAFKASLYTGTAYLITVILLILPFFIIPVPVFALCVTLFIAVLIIFVFNYYISVAKDLPFRKRFLEMTAVSLGVSAITFLIGWLIRSFIGLEV